MEESIRQEFELTGQRPGSLAPHSLAYIGDAVYELVIRSVIFEPVRVDGTSMDDTLADGEIMFVSKFDYSSTWLCLPWQDDKAKENAPRFTIGGDPKRFDVVICRYPGRGDLNFVKRVIGLPGDTLRLEALPPFVYDSLRKQDILQLFSAETRRLTGREMRVQLSELKPGPREVRDLEELRRFPEVSFTERS